MLSAVRRARALCVLLALAFVAALVPAPAQALTLMTEDNNTLSGPRGQWGYDYRTQAWQGAGYIGARFVRATIANRPSFSWDAIDEFIDDANARDFTPYLTINWAPGGGGLPVPTVGDFETFCQQVAQRYVPRGVRHFSVMNEPNWFRWRVSSSSTTETTIPAATYGALFRACAARVRAVAASAGVIVKVYFGELAAGSGGCSYLANAMSSSAATVADGIAFHPYQWLVRPGDPTATCSGISSLGDWSSAVATQFNAGKLRTPSGGKPTLALTEFGYCIAGSRCVNLDNESGADASTMTEETRADWLGRAFAIAERNSEVELFSYYHLTDGHGTSWNTGIVTAETGAPSLSARKLREVTGTADPTASVGGAGNVGETTATVNGTVDPKGARTTFHFEYGTTTAYGNSTAEQTLAAESGPTPVSAVVSGLAQDTRYHWRLVVRSRTGSGEAVGASFRTRDDYGGSDVVVSQVFDSAGNLFATTYNPLYQQQTAVRFVDTTFPGPFGVGDAGSVRTAPTQAFDSDGTLYVVFQGANHTLQISSYSPDRRWFGPVQIGDGGSTYSTPAIGIAPDGTILVAARGPDNRLVITVREADRITWHRPVDPFGTPNTTYSTPAVSFDRSGVFHVVAQGADHSLYLTRRQSGTWRLQTLSGSNTTYSQPGLAFSPTGALFIVNRGPDDSLRVTERSPDERTLYGPYARGGVNTTFSSPSAAFDRYGVLYVVAQGPMNSMYVSSRMPDTTWTGPLQLAPSGTVFSAPSIAFSPQGTLFAAAQGPSNSMSFTTRLDDGTVNPPVVIGPQGTTGREP